MADFGLVALVWCGFLAMAFDLAVTVAEAAAVPEGLCCRRGLVTRRRGVEVIVVGAGCAGATAVVLGF